MQIERANIEDLAEILALQKLAYSSEAKLHDDFQIPPLTETLDELCDKFKTHFFLKATEQGRIVGSVRVLQDEGTCYVGRLMVHPDYQNHGIGTKLLLELERQFSCGRFELFTGERSLKNIRLYEKLGYQRFKVERFGDNFALVYMAKIKS
jgi:ribosomal protein S18 acetylase RimI-like enzyme